MEFFKGKTGLTDEQMLRAMIRRFVHHEHLFVFEGEISNETPTGGKVLKDEEDETGEGGSGC